MTKGEPLRDGQGCCKVVNTATMVMANKKSLSFRWTLLHHVDSAEDISLLLVVSAEVA